MKAFRTLSIFFATSLLCAGAQADVVSKIFALSSGQSVPVGQLEAVGRLPGCTATLITERLVLTAAHCVCPSENNALNCSTRTTFTLTDVRPSNNPATPADESQFRTDVAVPGNVIVHPSYTTLGWLRSDFAIIVLDQPIWQVATAIQPIPVADSAHAIHAGDTVTLVGYGATGTNCANAPLGKLRLSLPVSDVVPDAIRFNQVGDVACPGDSGGPALDSSGWVAGVASWTNSTDESTYRPAWEALGWINSIRTSSDPGPAEGTVVFGGMSRDLDAYRPAQQYTLKAGAVDVAGIAIAGSNDVVYAWYRDGTVSAGDTRNLISRRAPYNYTLPPGKSPLDIVDLGIAGSDDHVYAWYRDGTVSSGTSSDLDAYRPPQPYTLPAGKTVNDVVGIGIAGSNDHVYVWYADGTVSSGTTRDFDAYSLPQVVSMPPERSAGQIMALGIAGSDDHVYSWFKPHLR